MSVFLGGGCRDKDGRSLPRAAIGILGPTRSSRPLQLHTTRILTRRSGAVPLQGMPVVGLPPRPPTRPPSGDGVTLNSNVFTVCSASISPDPPDDGPLLRPVVLANPLKRPFACVNDAAARDGLQRESVTVGATNAARAEAASGVGGPFSRKDRIPRPPNAFMLFANEFRKKLSCENPRESNKDISVRLGTMWKHMAKEKKDQYFELARLVDAEHKKKYPDYVYNPKEARLRKAMRDQVRSRSQGGRSAAGTPGAGTTGAGRPQHSPQHSPQPQVQVKKKVMLSPRRVPEQPQQPQQQQQQQPPQHHQHQQQQQQRLNHSVREQVEAGLLQSYDDAFVDLGYHHHQQQEAQGMQSWYPAPVQGADSNPSMRQWSSSDCLAASPHVSPFGGRMALAGSGCMVPEDMDDIKMKVEPTSQDGQAFSAMYKESSVAEDRPGSLGLDDALDCGGPAAPAPTRLPGFQETFCSNDVSRGGLFYSSAALELQVQTSPHAPVPQLLGESLLASSAPPDWPPLLFLQTSDDAQAYAPGYPDRTLFPAPSPPYSPFGFCDYGVLDLPAVPVSVRDCSPPTPSAPYSELTELHPYMHHLQYRAPSFAAPADLADMEALLKQEELGDLEQCEQQATLRRVMCAEPIIIQENERICVVRETGPARTFTAM